MGFLGMGGGGGEDTINVNGTDEIQIKDEETGLKEEITINFDGDMTPEQAAAFDAALKNGTGMEGAGGETCQDCGEEQPEQDRPRAS